MVTSTAYPDGTGLSHQTVPLSNQCVCTPTATVVNRLRKSTVDPCSFEVPVYGLGRRGNEYAMSLPGGKDSDGELLARAGRSTTLH